MAVTGNYASRSVADEQAFRKALAEARIQDENERYTTDLPPPFIALQRQRATKRWFKWFRKERAKSRR